MALVRGREVCGGADGPDLARGLRVPPAQVAVLACSQQSPRCMSTVARASRFYIPGAQFSPIGERVERVQIAGNAEFALPE